MSSSRSHIRALLAALVAGLVALTGATAFAAPSPAQVSESRALVDRAMQRFEAAQERSDRLGEQLATETARLDGIVEEQRALRAALTARANAMYRSGNTGFVSVLLGAETFDDFTARWELLARINRRDAEDLLRLERSRAKAASTSERLLRLQAESARSADAVERELARARRELAADEAALREYRSRVRAQRAQSTSRAPAKADTQQRLEGTGAWKNGVASHYGINFTGRGANGEEIGPYSMIVAHKTLPFGTLIEFEYRGQRAVARVADRGPHVAGREFDLGPGVARVLGFRGVDTVRYRIIER